MPLYGSSFPLDGKGFVVTVVCPNQGSHSALMRSLNNITPEAYEPGPPPPLTAEREAIAAGEPATCGGASSQIEPLEPRLQGIRDPEQEDDTGEPYPIPSCATGACHD